MLLRSVLLFPICVQILYAGTTRQPERHKVIIVGAGVSGFTAAVTLLEHNVTDVLVLEASDRIGGRIHTVEFGDVPIDKGAEFVHGEKDNSVFELVNPFNFLTSYEPWLSAETHLFANESGHGVHSTRIKELMDKSYTIFDEPGLAEFDGSVGEYFYKRLDELLKEENVDPKLSESIRHIVTFQSCVYDGSDSLYEEGARGFSDGWENEGDLTLKWKTGGYKTLFDILSKKHPNPSEELPVMNKTLFGKQVTQIEHKAGEVEVTCADGSTYLADHVIVTVSLGVLKKHAASMFKPGLSTEKTTAIETIKFGCVGKVFMLFPTKWWPNDTNVIIPLFTKEEIAIYTTTPIYWTVNTAGFFPVTNHERMLCAWFVGESCRTMESLTEEQISDDLTELLNNILGKMMQIPKPEKILRTTWASNPFVLGSYSYRSVESDRKNVSNKDLEAPIMEEDKPVVLFAGEATHFRYLATVHGALDTGRREAYRIIDYIREHKTNG